MHTIAVASQKGGSGKTTLSGHLAVEAVRAGAGAVALIDTDPQGSLSDWWNARKGDEPHFVKVGPLDLAETLAELDKMGIQIALIDTPPAITESISHVISHADLVIVPTRPSPHDLRAVGATVDIAERRRKPLIFVINAATPRARITGDSAVALSQHGTVAPVMIHQRVDFAASMVDGRTVGEVVASSQSAREITELWRYVQDRLSRIVRESDPLRDALANQPVTNAAVPEIPEVPAVPATIVTPNYEGPDRRVAPPGPRLNGPERRTQAFGRRPTDPAYINSSVGQ
jgi:chromosome partitioning protein